MFLSTKFETVPIGHHEHILFRRIYDRSPVKLACFRLMAKSALSLDEFCINFADEVMHSYFIRHILEDCRLQQPADRRWCLLGIHHDYGQLAMFIASAWRAAQYTLNQETR